MRLGDREDGPTPQERVRAIEGRRGGGLGGRGGPSASQGLQGAAAYPRLQLLRSLLRRLLLLLDQSET